MSGRLRQLGRQTVEIAETGHYTDESGRTVHIGDEVTAAVADTVLHLPEDNLDLRGIEHATPVVEVTGETTLAAARRLADEGVTDVACLVFASAKNPGGGFLGGAKAQEEDLARCSALYRCQLQAPDFYAFHRHQHDLRYSDRVIHSPRVPVFRDEALRLSERPFPVGFLTAAAPNLGAIERNQPQDAADVPRVLRRRAKRVLTVAAAHRHRTLVLGAWGCGVFRNDPREVAEAFAEALTTVDHFDRVVFAVLDNRRDTPVRGAFDAVFA